MSNSEQTRWWLFTLNNPEVTPEEVWQRSQMYKAGYLAGQLERGESGTPHYQFVTWTKEKTRRSTVKKAFPQAHMEVVKGTPEQAIAYCTKEETRVSEPFFFGELPIKRNSKEDWEAVFLLAQAGRMDLIPAKIKVQHYGNLQRIAKDHIKGVDFETVRGIWIVGSPGQGKTHWARMHLAKGSYYAKMANKWWDGYQGESVVVLDDLDKKAEVLAHHLKIWSDKWSFTAEAKGSAIAPQYHMFVVTSNYAIEDIIKEDPQMLAAIQRRFKVFTLVQDRTGTRTMYDKDNTPFEPEVLSALLRSDYGLK